MKDGKDDAKYLFKKPWILQFVNSLPELWSGSFQSLLSSIRFKIQESRSFKFSQFFSNNWFDICFDWTLAVTANLDNFSIFGRAFYSLPNSAVTTNSNQKFDFTAHLGNNKQQGYWVTTHVQRFYVVKILLARRSLY